MRRHSLHAGLQADGGAALSELVLGTDGGGLRAMLAEREGVETLVGAMHVCAAEGTPMRHAQMALQALADAQPTLLPRITRANGAKYLRTEPAAELQAPEAAS